MVGLGQESDREGEVVLMGMGQESDREGEVVS